MTVPNNNDFIGYKITESQFKNALIILLSHIRQMSIDLIGAQGGNYSYATIFLFESDKANVPANSSVQITNDAENNGIYTWDGEILTKSDFSLLDDFLINEGDNWSTL